MTDIYTRVANAPVSSEIFGRVGLPRPVELARYRPGQPSIPGPVVVGGSGRLADAAKKVIEGAGTQAVTDAPAGGKAAALVFDASGIKDAEGLRELYDFFHPIVRSLRENGRVVVLGTPPEAITDVREHVAQRALEGFTRSIAKELNRGATAQLVYVAEGAEGAIESTLRFFLSPRSAYVSGQVVRIEAAETETPADWERPLAGKVIVVTGAAQGIGEAMAETLARDGATVVAVDVPAQGDALTAVAATIGGEAFPLDVTADDTPQKLVDYIKEKHDGKLDGIVHNAGVTRDKLLKNMSEDKWDLVLQINLASQLRINDALLDGGVLGAGGRIIGVSSIAGVAGNRGQTNYGTTKAGVIGMVEALAPVLREHGATINAVAPGFIETAMTAKMPFATREVGRRLNSLQQGGLPVDVAEAVAWFASPASSGVNGNAVRICGQSLIGA
jgi:3-oxoacyl-[acyl-carrier protein] reductase